MPPHAHSPLVCERSRWCFLVAWQLRSAYELLASRSSVGDAHRRLQEARAREPWLIRAIWRGPSLGVKLGLKLAIMTTLMIAGIADDQARAARTRRRIMSPVS